MRLKIYLAAVVAVILLSPANAQADKPEVWASQSFTATHRAQSWQSSVAFGPQAVVYVSVWVGDEELPSEQLYGCLMFFNGYGLHARVNLCGQTLVPLRLRYHTTGRKRLAFNVVYEMESPEAMREDAEGAVEEG